MTDKKVTDYVETLQLAIEQVQNPELREDASNALTALLQTWVQPTPEPEYTPWRDPMADILAAKLREFEAMKFDMNREFYGDEAPAPPWRPITPEFKMDKKTKDFVEVYAQGRARNKVPGKGKNLRP